MEIGKHVKESSTRLTNDQGKESIPKFIGGRTDHPAGKLPHKNDMAQKSRGRGRFLKRR